MSYDFDVISIGAGSGGCATAIRATDLGLKAMVLEKRQKNGVGGTCINRGCIPTKTLLRTVAVMDEVKKAADLGVEVGEAKPDIKKIMKRRHSVTTQLGFSLRTFVLGGRKIPVKFGDVKILDPHTVELTTKKGAETFTTKNIMIATGSEPALIPAFNIDRVNILTSDETLSLEYIPESMIIVGGGHIGIEMGTFYATMGTKVTLVEALDNIASSLADQELCDLARELVEARGIEVVTGVMIDKMEVTGENEVTAFLKDGTELKAQKALISIGRTTNLAGLGLEDLGLQIEHGRIITNEAMQSNIPSIYAVGDVSHGSQLSSKAQSEGLTAAENMAGNPERLDYDVLPWTIFSKPEMTKVGLSSSEAAAKGIETFEGVLHMENNEKAVCNAETEGMVKIVVEKESRKIIGGMIVCNGASNMIAELATAMRCGMTIDELAVTMHSHPTYSEAVLECAKNAIGKAFHK